MRKILVFMAFIPVLVLAQTQDHNYIKNTTYKDATTTPISSPDPSQATVQITYYDGLGRPIQKIAHGQSNGGWDIITPIAYDGFGREEIEYLPYVKNGRKTLDFEQNAVDEQLSFYVHADPFDTGNNFLESTANPFSQKLFENSPSNTLLKQAAPGDDWAMGNGKEVKFDYQTNAENEVAKYYAATSENSCGVFNPVFAQDGVYQPGQLYKTVTKDENWISDNEHTTQEFKDREGRVVLKRTYDIDAHDTHFVYDDYGNLTFVLPPLASISGTVNQSVIDKVGYQYKYDFRNRLVAKKLPGKQWEYIAYDALDRPTVTGPVNSPFGDQAEGYMYTKYDAFGRVCYTGWFPYHVSEGDYCVLTSEIFVAESTEATVSENTIDGIVVKYTADKNPTGLKILTVNYYDNYTFPNAAQIPTDVYGCAVYANVKGLQTGAWVRALKDPASIDGETTTTFYNTKAQVIASNTTNFLGGYTNIKTSYNFIGQPLRTTTAHRRNPTGTVVNTDERFTYNPQGKQVTHTHKVNNGPTETLACNGYDELGNLIVKNVGGVSNECEGLQKVDYTYNIRGWLKSINDTGSLQQASAPEDLFAFRINYNTVESPLTNTIQPLYNGNISETTWIAQSDNFLRRYSYSYDALNRLEDAIYQRPGEVVEVTNSYDESIQYDYNGNITSLDRTGNLDSQSFATPIDNLIYTYDPQSPNQLTKVVDYSNDTNGFKDANGDGQDFFYDANGNMTKDLNKGITSIAYNHLNLPTDIIFSNGKNIHYLYNALGEKLQKVVTDSIATATDYLGKFQYKNSILQFFPTAEGYVNYTPGELFNNYSYVYNYLDHWGNIRVSYSKDPSNGELKILEESHYYPFGLKHTNYNSDLMAYKREENLLKIKPVLDGSISYNYKYQGQERQDELGLNWDAFKWRNYDYALGRFMSIDPLSEKYVYNSVYAFQENKMGMGRELEGLEMEVFTKVMWDAAAATSYNPETGNLDLAEAAVKFFSGFFNDAPPQRREPTSNKDMESTATSKKGGNENQHSTGNVKNGNFDGGAIVDVAPSKAGGNKYKSGTDAIKYVKSITSGEKKGEKAGAAVSGPAKDNRAGGKTTVAIYLNPDGSEGMRIENGSQTPEEAKKDSTQLMNGDRKEGGRTLQKVEIK